ncbi:MAG: tetratricopeptide repeat protein [Actinopolymorphaceae bacterium]
MRLEVGPPGLRDRRDRGCPSPAFWTRRNRPTGHRKQGRSHAAAGLYEDVLAQARQIGKPNWTFEALQGLGRTRLSLDRPDDALACHQEALDIADEMKQPADVARGPTMASPTPIEPAASPTTCGEPDVVYMCGLPFTHAGYGRS